MGIRIIGDPQKRQSFGYANLEQRGFKDNHPFPFGPWVQPTASNFDLTLTIQTLRRIYRLSSSVRPAVTFLVRTLSTTPWRIIADPGVSKRDFEFAVDLFTKPGPGAKTFRELLAKTLTDLFVLDELFIEKIRVRGGNLIEFSPRDPATFAIIPGDSGEIKGYEQRLMDPDGTDMKVIKFSEDDIMRVVMYPRTNSFKGTPVVEAIVDEVTALMLASQGLSAFFSDDELPQGLLHMGEIGAEAFKRAQADFENKRGLRAKRKLRTTYGRSEPKWIPFNRPFREMEIANIMPRIERIVFRNFGVTPLDLGMSADVNRSTSEAFKEIRTFTLFKPILDLLAESFTFDILHEINEGLFLEFVHFSRTGQESDADNALGTQDKPVDTDIPGEGEGKETDTSSNNSGNNENGDDDSVTSSVDRGYQSPLFGAFGMDERRGLICRPNIYRRTETKKSFSNPVDLRHIMNENLLELVANDSFKRYLDDAIESTNTVVETLLEESAEEIYDMVRSKATSKEVRTLTEYTYSEIYDAVKSNISAVENRARIYISSAMGINLETDEAEDLMVDYSSKLREIVVDQVFDSTIPFDEEAAFIRAFDADKLKTDDLIKLVAVKCFRAALKHR